VAVENSQWWEKASPAQIVDAYREAKTYEPEDQTAADAVARMNTEIRDRFGIDVDDLGRGASPADELERLYADHVAQHAAAGVGDGLAGVESPGAGVGGREEVLAGFRDYCLSRSLAAVSSAGSIEDVAAMSPPEGQPQARRERVVPGQGQERDRGR